MGNRAGPCTCNALRGSHGSLETRSKFLTRAKKSPKAIRASIRASAAPRHEWMP